MHDHTKPNRVKIVVCETPAGKDGGPPCECLRVGDEFQFDFERCPQDFCASAFVSLWASLRVLEMGGRHPWDTEAGVTHSCCPDANRPVVFRLETVQDDET